MQTFENLILQNCSTERVIKVCSNGGCHLDLGLCDGVCVIKVCSSGYNNNVKLYNIAITKITMSFPMKWHFRGKCLPISREVAFFP